MLCTLQIRSVLAALISLAPLATCQQPEAARSFKTPYGRMLALHEQPDAKPLNLRLWLTYPNHTDDYLDQLDYLEELRTKWSSKGVSIGVVLPTTHARLVAASKPNLLVVGPRADDEQANSFVVERLNGSVMLCNAADDEVLCAMATIDGIDAILDAATGGKPLQPLLQAKSQLQALIEELAEGGNYRLDIRKVVRVLPNCGRAQAARVLNYWWGRGDLEQAQQAVLDGIEALNGQSLPMSVFADLVLRGDHYSPAIAELLAKEMAPIAAANQHGTFAQLVYLRALLKSSPGNRETSRQIGRITATLPKRLQGRDLAQVIFAETLMDADTPLIYRDAAERALAAATGNKALERWLQCARHKVLQRCGEHAAASELLKEYREQPTELNDNAWYLMVQLPTMGRFDTFAFALAHEMETVEGNQISANSKDTLALAYFCSGNVKRALELQKETNPKEDASFLGRLKRYEATLKQQQSKQSGDK
jgi:hypothetical protein